MHFQFVFYYLRILIYIKVYENISTELYGNSRFSNFVNIIEILILTPSRKSYSGPTVIFLPPRVDIAIWSQWNSIAAAVPDQVKSSQEQVHYYKKLHCPVG
jgi:hypothetical protein